MTEVERQLDDFCPICGLKYGKKSLPGSMTGYLFDPVKCKCDLGDTVKPDSTIDRIHRVQDERADLTFAQIGQQNFDQMSSAIPLNVSLEAGTIIGGSYRIIEMIGQGGMGQIYLAEHETLKKPCALKFIPPSEVTSNTWKRFQQEAKSIAALEHINIVKVTDLGVHKGYLPYYAMEYVEGQTMAQMLAKNGKMPWKNAIDIFVQVCDGVDHAHRAGIIHRDLKPANIMLVRTTGGDGKSSFTVKILDFGLAKLAHKDRDSQSLTMVGDIFGSPFYMSPEQCNGEKVDNRSDIYSLGCTLFECLTGRPPFNSPKIATVVADQRSAEPPSLESIVGPGIFPDAIEIVMAKLLRKNPVERYQTCRELSGDLLRVARGEAVQPFYMSRTSATPKEGDDAPPAVRLLERTDVDVRDSGLTPKLVALVAAGVLLIGGAAVTVMVMPHAKQKTHEEALPQDFDLMDKGTVNELRRLNPLANKTGKVEQIPVSSFKTAPYASHQMINGRDHKVFDFPDDVSIGDINGLTGKPQPATGKFICLADEKLYFEPGPLALEFPAYMKRFAPGDLHGIILRGGPSIGKTLQAVASMPGWDTSIHVLSIFSTGPESAVRIAISEDVSSAVQGKNFTEAALKKSFDMDDESWKILRSFKGLDLLRISGDYLPDKKLATLPWLSSLRIISLESLSGCADSLAAVKNSRSIVQLTVIGTKLSETDIQNIAAMPVLENLTTYKNVETLPRLAVISHSKSIARFASNAALFTLPGIDDILQDWSGLKALTVCKPSILQLKMLQPTRKKFNKLDWNIYQPNE